MNTPFDDTLQSLFDSSLSALSETPTFCQDFHTSSPFDDPHSFAQTYQTEHFYQENHWHNAAFQSAPVHSLTQQVDSLLNSSDSSDESNLNTASETHHVLRSEVHHYHHIVRPNPTTYGGDGSSDDNSCSIDSDSSSGTGGCADANGGGVCDSAGSSNDD